MRVQIFSQYCRLRLLPITCLLFFVSGLYFTAMANDEYNFYFQKSPNIVNNGENKNQSKEQGVESGAKKPGGSEKNNLAPVNPTPVSMEIAPELSAIPVWEIGLHYYMGLNEEKHTIGNSHHHSGVGVSAQANLSQKFGLRLEYSTIKETVDVNVWPYGWTFDRRHHTGSFGLVFTPVRIRAATHDFLTFTAIAGAAYTMNRMIKPYVAPELGLNFSKSFGLRAQYRYLVGNSWDFTYGSEFNDSESMRFAAVMRF